MMTSLIAFLEKRSPALISALSFTLLAAVASLNYHLDHQLSFSVFYLIPIGVVTLYAGRRVSFLVCFIAAVLIVLINQFSSHPYSSSIAIWNGSVDFAYFLLMAYLLSKLKIHLSLLNTLIRKDDLTGAYNTRGFRDEAHNRLMLADRYAHSITLARIDIEGFKALIDTKGRLERAHILRNVANTITQCIRVTDIVGRLGGDEFVVLLPETDYSGAQKMFKRIHDALDRQITEGDWPISFSISVATYKKAPSTIDEALQYVDRIMYRLKKMGKKDILYEEQTGGKLTAYHER